MSGEQEPEDNELYGDDDFDWEQPTMGEMLVEAVLEHDYTGEQLRSSNYGIENSLCRMAEAFADTAEGDHHIRDLTHNLREHGKLDGATARDQAKHAFDVMKLRLPDLGAE